MNAPVLRATFTVGGTTISTVVLEPAPSAPEDMIADILGTLAAGAARKAYREIIERRRAMLADPEAQAARERLSRHFAARGIDHSAELALDADGEPSIVIAHDGRRTVVKVSRLDEEIGGYEAEEGEVTLRIQPADEEAFECSMDSFLEANEREVSSEVRRLKVGESTIIGGGAAPMVIITRVPR